MEAEVREPERIVVIDLLYMGDLLFATPFFRNLRQKYPEAKIDLIVNANFYDIIEDNPHFDEVYAYDKDWSITKSIQFARQLRSNDYDLGLNIHGNWRTAILLRIINPDYNVGYGTKGRGIWLDRSLVSSENKHMVEVYLDFLRELGFSGLDDKGLELEIDPQAEESMEEFLASQGITEAERLVGLNTGGSWPTKQWMQEGFAQLADRLRWDYDSRVIFFGGPGDVERVEEIAAQMETEPVIAAGKTGLKELAALASFCDLFISGDTGPVHVAAAVGTPTIAIFGPSDETKYQPYGDQHQVVKTELNCRPCGEHHCPEEHHNCMADITVEDILEIVEEGM
ncbi:lipopolysaccharide heptosyltransferase II [Acetohalobium arabaticum]|uniref:lipopolysaccharide heptosyltransferase II n=1 Tax=Acetohalobium arabaticum (strain ATCC 49924 / DSM 5501 / Z-7288) TaxID=574087 RepID=D9QTT3_ACEAZ|nr:lipopolysaccharide heptosyltransferase II [Acetohalobium arabaticum]ADL13654.1 glycosyl transferase family 9 [Acetohalobium arabaticum DSM 5501]